MNIPDLDLDDIVRRAASEHRMVRDDVLTADVPALVAALRDARAEVERLTGALGAIAAVVAASKPVRDHDVRLLRGGSDV